MVVYHVPCHPQGRLLFGSIFYLIMWPLRVKCHHVTEAGSSGGIQEERVKLWCGEKGASWGVELLCHVSVLGEKHGSDSSKWCKRPHL